MLKNIIRAARLPFICASVLPFLFGSLIERDSFNFLAFIFGFICVCSTHISANLINDYADSRSGVDWQDKDFYIFFGGSKLIQSGRFSEAFYLRAALLFASFAIISAILLALILKSIFVLLIFVLIIFLSWQYTAKPFQFSYHFLGEFFIFLLFGPVLVMGGYFIQTGIFPDIKSFLMSLPLGLFTAAILLANEVPDSREDSKFSKNNWVKLCKAERAYLLYYFLMFLGFSSILVVLFLDYLNLISAASFLLIIPAVKVGQIIKKDYASKNKLMQSSKLTINMQMLVSLALIAGLIL
ncbi:MAG: prenyltransferase [Candidatus Omnitrophica bacterium]|nr:prenyltransferase [Candidatus Omnitrophota bacterium]